MPADHDTANPPKNRYAAAPMRADWTIVQDWPSYSAAEHDRWSRLFARQLALLPGRACDDYLAAMEKLRLSQGGVPNFAELSARLEPLTGWSVIAVAGLVPDAVFFDHLAERRFPAAAFIRPESELDYLEEPDVFHDVFGHVPLLADPVYARFLQAYGEGGRRALARGQLAELARLYWYTVEFGLVSTPMGLRIFGAGILSSPAESVFALEDTSSNRIHFDLERVMRTRYIIDNFQQSYFVVDSFQSLLDACYTDFGPIYDRLIMQPTLEPHAIAPGDRIVTRGDFHYFRAKADAA
jgi:phenylalanine-4-hydroxylase